MKVSITKAVTETVDVSTSELVRVTAELIREKVGLGRIHYLERGDVVFDVYTGGHNNDIETVVLRPASKEDFDAFKALQVINNLI